MNGRIRTPGLGGHHASVVRFDDVPVDDVLADGASPGGDELRRVANAAMALASLDVVGVGEAVMERTVRYTTMRHQFGRPIASFQAAQHIVADMHIALAAARLAAQSAVHAIDQGRTAIRETAIARIQSATAAKWATLDAHQLHGGMGYVVETDLYLWSEQARVLSTLGGGADIAVVLRPLAPRADAKPPKMGHSWGVSRLLGKKSQRANISARLTS